MKGYGIFLLTIALLLMLIPLPALPHSKAAVAPVAEVSGETPTDPATEPTDTAAGVFRLKTDNGIVTLDEADFLCRTLFLEMPPTYHTEALKAQAVAAYTYYARRRAAQRKSPDAALEGADFTVTGNTFPGDYTPEKLQQRFGSQYSTYEKKIREAVNAVRGKVMTYGGELIDSCYFAISCGCTDAAATVWGNDVPYLQPVASPGDTLSPQYETVVTFSGEQVKKALLSVDAALTLGDDPAGWFGSPTLAESGTVTSVPVGGRSLTGTQIRKALDLRAAAFTVSYKENAFCFTVHGYGHNVGMSQYGADYLARQGYTWDEILHYYYKDVSVTDEKTE